MKRSCRMDPVWQRMRDEGMMVKDIAAEAGVSTGEVTRRTVPARGWSERIGEAEKAYVIKWYEAGLELPEIARNSRLPKAVCERIIYKAIAEGAAAPRSAGRPAKRLKSADASDIPDITELAEKDRCPGRVLRGLSPAEYARLIEVNKEYDERREKRTDDH